MNDDILVLRWHGPGDDAPGHFDYEIADNHDATNGEFWLNAFGRATEKRHGVGLGWLESYLSVPRGANEGSVKAAGLWARCQVGDRSVECYALGSEIEPDYWLAGFPIFRSDSAQSGPHIQSTQLIEFAFFADLMRPSGEHVRLWQSRRGANYTMQDAFGLPCFMKSTEHGTIEYASEESVLFEEKRRLGR